MISQLFNKHIFVLDKSTQGRSKPEFVSEHLLWRLYSGRRISGLRPYLPDLTIQDSEPTIDWSSNWAQQTSFVRIGENCTCYEEEDLLS